jgi:hypothetical protein
MSDYDAMYERLQKGKERLKEFDCVGRVEQDDNDVGYVECKVWPNDGYSLHDLYLAVDGFETEDYWITMAMECDDFWYVGIHTTQ